MNKISNEKINKYLEDKWNIIKEKSGIEDKKLMGIFAIGKTCYDFVYSIDDIELMCYYIPSFEELCLNTYKFNYCEKFCDVKMIDFRYVYNLLLEQDRIAMEATYTDYKIINEPYKQSFEKYVLQNKEILFHYNNEARIRNATERAISLINKYTTTFNQNELSTNDLFEICRIRIACELLLSGTSVENCINLKKDYHINYLTDILDEKIKPNLDELENELYELQERSKAFVTVESTKDLMQELLFNLYTIGLTKQRDFSKMLTKTEQDAFNIIKDNLDNGSGYISVSQLTENNAISRPVFKNVLQKMKDSKVAIVENKGVKGTYIQINDSTIL